MFNDVRFGLRVLGRDRAFTITALLTLTICLAANTAIFGLVRSVLFKPLPVPEADRLVFVINSYPRAGAPRTGTAVPDYYDRLTAMPSLSEQAILRRETVTVSGADGALQVVAVRATPSFFRLVRLEPAHGRTFRDDEGEPGRDGQVLLSYGFWIRHLGGDPSVVGTTLRVNGTARTIVGIAPSDFTFIWNDIDFFVPAAFTPDERGYESRHSNNWQMVARLAPGMTLATAQAELDALNATNIERFPEWKQILSDAGFHSLVLNLQDDLVRDVRPVLYLLWGGVGFVLLIGGVNLANLVMIRATTRAREMATRHAVGAGLGRLARQLVTETVMLAVAGGVAGVLLGIWVLDRVAVYAADQLPRAHEIAVDATSVAGVLALTVLIGVALALAPVWRLRRANLSVDLREDSRGGTAGRGTRFMQRSLATAQVAIAFVLLFGAGLLFASFRAVLTEDPGFNPAGVQSAGLNLTSASYPRALARQAFVDRLLESVEALPGVEAAGVTTVLPFGGGTDDSVLLAEGYTMAPGESLISPTQSTVSPGYFESLNIRLVAGRLFSRADVLSDTQTVIIDERLASKWWPGRDPIGRRVYFPTDLNNVMAVTPDTVFMTVIGVVGEVRMGDPRLGLSPVGAYYLPYSATAGRAPTQITLTYRTALGGGDFNAVRGLVAGMDPDLPLFQVRSLEEWIDRAFVGRRLPMYLAMMFGAIGLLLSAIGIYGVLAFGVNARQRELGVRMALGGSTAQVFRLVLRDGVLILAAGLAVGAVGAALAGQVIAGQLHGVSMLEPRVVGAAVAILVTAALLACVVPALRAARIAPASVLGR